ncbi:hypothetical protein [Kosmotoga pacifica]|uniref:Uncharacterized protein n=1 Tax=Kosmotoga pacifica TaxID=1330330 RepID=A0A0G2Z532_9BACT|nr:hypothetical protein [Kosmotoga pacifica]AKI96662.1 hypothetical protein IX53_01200 [Kosmotoga pacifica]
MKKVFLLLALLVSTFALSCVFNFEPEVLSGNVGDIVIVRVDVEKTHRRCTLDSMDDYHFEFENVQVLGETPWNQVDEYNYQKWFKLCLSEAGEGFVKIWKNCTKEGYDEAILPITISENVEVLEKIREGIVPFDTPLNVENPMVESFYQSEEKTIDKITLKDIEFELPIEIHLSEGDVYVLYSKDYMYPIAVAGRDFFYRFDYYILSMSRE